jgi:hypothetical protein
MLYTDPAVALIPTTDTLASTLRLRVMECPFTLHNQAGTAIGHALHIAFAGLCCDPQQTAPAGVGYVVRPSSAGLEIAQEGKIEAADDLGDLLYLLDKQITLTLQGSRKDLVFIHGGAVTTPDGRVIVLTAASGSGKSTLTWALLHHGFGYMSDELAPIDPVTLNVQAYPHAVCLKKPPPPPYDLPPETLTTTRSLHVPVAASGQAGSLAAILFVDHRHPEGHPMLTPVNAARAALRLYPNTLNPLAHPNDGLDAVATIVRQVPCYELNTLNLPAACEAVRALF